MFMPKLGIMHPRNRFSSRVVAGLFLTALLFFAENVFSQAAPAQAQGNTAPPTTVQQPAGNGTQSQPSTAPQSQPSAPGTTQGQTGSPSSAPANQAQPQN